MKKIPTLETKRLLLRSFLLEDATVVQELAGDRAIADTTLTIPHPYVDGIAQDWISSHQETFDKGEGVTFAICSRNDEIVIGAISLTDIAAGHQAELGYWIGRPYWNQGYCTEAGAAVLQYAFAELGLLRVHSHHLSRNPASGRVMLKLGMTPEGLRRQHLMKWGKCEDDQLYGILKEEWEAGTNKVIDSTSAVPVDSP